jgi:hypothetical protein
VLTSKVLSELAVAGVLLCLTQDDFYILDSHLVVTETSNSILDGRVWKAVVPQSALSWQRVLVANWLSRDGADYAHWVKKHNSGGLTVVS